MPQQAGPRWHQSRRCWRARFPGAEYRTTDIDEKDQRRAWDWYHEMRRDYERRSKLGVKKQETIEPGDYSLQSICLRYLQELSDEVEAGTRPRLGLINARTRIRCFFKHSQLADCPISEFTATKFMAVFKQPEMLKLSPAYRSVVWGTVKTALNWAASPVDGRNPERLIVNNPLQGAKPPPLPRTNKYIASKEIRKFFRRCWGLARKQAGAYQYQSKMTLIMARMIRLTGARPSEIRHLMWSDIDWNTGQIVFPWQRHKTGKRTQKNRTIFLTRQTIRLLRFVERLGVSKSNHVFTTLRGTPWDLSTYGTRIRTWKKQLGVTISLTAYSSRHTYCSEALASGAELANVAKLMGDSPATLIQNYDHAINAKLSAVAEEVARMQRRF